jgi:hypothetical protein
MSHFLMSNDINRFWEAGEKEGADIQIFSM